MVLRQLFFAVALLLIAGPIAAQDEADTINANRPGFGDSAATLKRGDFQVEMGFAYSKFDDQQVVSLDGDQAANQKDFGELVLRYGLKDTLEMIIEAGSFSSRNQPDTSGFSENSIALKYRFYDKEGTVMSVTGGITTTTGIAFTGREGGGFVAYAMDKELGERSLSLYANYNENESNLTLSGYLNGNLSSTWNYAVGVAGFLNHGTYHPMVESLEDIFIPATMEVISVINWTEDKTVEFDVDNQFVLDVNFVHTLSRDSQLDFYLGAGLDNKSPDYFLGMGYARRF